MDQVRVVLDAEPHLPDPRVHAFLIGLAADPRGYDLARIECMKILRLSPPAGPAAWREAGRAVAAALAEDDRLVRQFAAMALGPYAQDDVVFAALAAAALHDEDLDVRYNAPIKSSFERGPLTEKPNAHTHRERPQRAFSGRADPQHGRDAVARGDTHPGLLSCEVQR